MTVETRRRPGRPVLFDYARRRIALMVSEDMYRELQSRARSTNQTLNAIVTAAVSSLDG